jgi:Fur family zinc uptake transcriptional regulator
MDLKTLEKWATAQGKTLTQPRKLVFKILQSSTAYFTAYDVVDRMPEGTKPMTVYRALDFLTAIGAAHRIESLNAYVVCREGHCAHTDSQYLICTRCQNVEELHDHALDHQINEVLSIRGFKVEKKSLEALGICKNCVSA